MTDPVSVALYCGLRRIHEILVSGDLLTARPDSRYCSEAAHSPFIPSFILESLQDICVMLPEFLKDQIMQQMRSYLTRGLANEIEADGMVRFFGRGSKIDPDSDTTACVAVCLAKEGLDMRRCVAALDKFQMSSGFYASYINDHGTLYTWINSDGSVDYGQDRVVQCNLLRAYAFFRQPRPWLVAYLQRELAHGNLMFGSRDYPYVLPFIFCAIRALRVAGESISKLAYLRCLEILNPTVSKAAPLSVAIALKVALDLNFPIREMDGRLAELLDIQSVDGGWRSEPFFVGDYGSECLSSALAVGVLAQYKRQCIIKYT